MSKGEAEEKKIKDWKRYSRRERRRIPEFRPARSRWQLLGYVLVFVVAFWFLHYVMKIG